MKKLDIKVQAETHWSSATDLMSGLMLIFLFIAVVYMIDSSNERDEMRKVAEDWAKMKHDIYTALLIEFKDDLLVWNADIEENTLIVRFKEPRVLFESNSSVLTDKFKEILASFFPRYINVLRVFNESISEIRIEGHTSSEWNKITIGTSAYFKNMELSQDRTRSVLEFCLPRTNYDGASRWAKDNLIAAGMSSSRLIMRDSKEDSQASRRVEFRVRTKADEKLSLILEKAEDLEKIQVEGFEVYQKGLVPQ